MDESISRLSSLNRNLVRAIAALVAVLTLSLSLVARAQDDSGDNSDAIAKATQLNKDAIVAYQAQRDRRRHALAQPSARPVRRLRARSAPDQSTHIGALRDGAHRRLEAARAGSQERKRWRSRLDIGTDEGDRDTGDAVGVRWHGWRRACRSRESDAKAIAPDSDATSGGTATPGRRRHWRGGCRNRAARSPGAASSPPPAAEFETPGELKIRRRLST